MTTMLLGHFRNTGLRTYLCYKWYIGALNFSLGHIQQNVNGYTYLNVNIEYEVCPLISGLFLVGITARTWLNIPDLSHLPGISQSKQWEKSLLF